MRIMILKVCALTMMLALSLLAYRTDFTVFAQATDQLRIFGLVNRPLNLSLDQLRACPMVSEVAELKCVFGAPDVTYIWTGIPLFYLLTLAQIKPEAYKIVTRARAYDGFESDILIEDALRPTTILALEANGTTQVQGIKGFPRLVVPLHWGYKWVAEVDEIEVVNTDYKGTYENSGYTDSGERPDSGPLPTQTPPMQTAHLSFGNRTFEIQAFTNASVTNVAFYSFEKTLNFTVTVERGA
jgi:DMSO/TMAO reductase YedYZ molybdopterin-dependent catalytic subunit